MEPFLVHPEQLLRTNLTVIENISAVEAVEDQTVTIFRKNFSEYYRLEKTGLEGHINYLPCAIIEKENLGFPQAASSLAGKRCLLVRDGSEIIGLIDASDLIGAMMQSYEKSQSFFQAILETMDESCIAIDANANVAIWTKGAEKIFSIDRQEIIGKPITAYFNPERLQLLKTLEHGTTLRHSRHQAREDLVVLINSNPVYWRDEIIGAVVSETDITSQVRLNDELYNTTEKLFTLEKEANKFLPSDPFQLIRGNSPKLKQTMDMARKAALTDTNILIHGESGVGKELFAKAVHTLRAGEKAPFIAINCGAIPSSLFESEIFGYEKGAFSGADNRGKKGKAELAGGGTLFLDEIGEMPLEMQVKILRLLQEKRFFAVGGTKEKQVDFHVIAATNRDLSQLVKEGTFREDLYYRLNVVSLEIPPLRKRPEDIIELSHYFLYEVSIKYNRPIHGISQEIMQALLKHDWPGNIRELKNVIERLVVFSDGGEVLAEYLPFQAGEAFAANSLMGSFSGDSRPLHTRLQDVEKEIILKELELAGGNKKECAKRLNITRATLYNRLHKLGIMDQGGY